MRQSRISPVIFKKTKIVATIGPNSSSERLMTAMAKAGMNVVRLNFSHGDHAEHEAYIKTARAVSAKIKRPIAIIQDLSGPKIRIGDFYKNSIVLKKGGVFTLTTKKITGDETKVFVDYPRLPREVKKGGIIMLNDGKEKLQVIRVAKNAITCKVLTGGEIKGRRGINVPDARLSLRSITDKDKKDLAFGLKQKVDFVAFSFVRRPEDVDELRAYIKKAKSDASIIAKIETREAIENIDEIIERADGIMIARGDLAIEVPAQDVPVLQKMIIAKCNAAGKPVITATQMLESMIKSPTPTRAEVSDIANSILDGTDAVMLSEETALGDYPAETVATMASVARRTEEMPRKIVLPIDKEKMRGIADSITAAVVKTARAVDAKVIVALTESGFTARMISRWKPSQPIMVMTPNERTRVKLALSYGCIPISIQVFKYVGQVTDEVKRLVRIKSLAKKGDRVVIAAGVPFGRAGSTNMLLVRTL